MNLLIVDDEPTTRALLRRALMRVPSLTIYEATDGLVALSELSKRRFGVVIMDLRMPVMSGIEVLEAMRTYPQLAGIAVVLMSAERSEGTVRRAIELGISGYLTKPLDGAKVLARLGPVLALAEQQMGTTPAPTGGGSSPSGLDGGASFLIVDGSADFRHFFVDTFAVDRPVLQATSGVNALIEAAGSRPDVIFIGSDLGPLSGEMLVRKLRGHPLLTHATLVAIRAKHGGVDLPGVDATVQRTFVSEAFRTQIDRIFGPPRPSGGTLIAQPSLRLQAASACEQVFGMMLELELETNIDDAEPIPAGAIATAQTIDWAEGNERLLFTLYLDEGSAARIGTAMLGLPADELDAELIESACGEVANIITGRLKTGFAASGAQVVCSLPQMQRTDRVLSPRGQRNTLSVSCRTAAKDLTCVMMISAVAAPVAEDPPAEPVAVTES